MKRLSPLIFLAIISVNLCAQLSTSFELRYYSKDKSTKGQTDFKGEKEYFNTEQRIDFLNVYANVASEWFSDTELNTKINDEKEIEYFLSNIKPQPLPETRKRLVLDKWKKTGFKYSAYEEYQSSFWELDTLRTTKIEEGALRFIKPMQKLDADIDTLSWRFLLTWRAMNSNGKNPLVVALKRGNKSIVEAGLHPNGSVFYTVQGADRTGEAYDKGQWINFRLEGDLSNGRYNLFVNDNKVADWVALSRTDLINKIEITGGNGIFIDYLKGIKFDTTGCSTDHPYKFIPFINETFDQPESGAFWMHPLYDDHLWKTDNLPIVRGGVLEAGEDLLLRKKIVPGLFEKAILHIETLDPGGEVWVNGKVAYVTHNRHPVEIDISDFLRPHIENTIAIRVYSFFNDEKLYHSSLDRNVGWFCGRAWLDLTKRVYIQNVKTHTKAIDGEAVQFHQIAISNQSDSTFTGNVAINYYAWHPHESNTKAASFNIPVTIFARDSIHVQYSGIIQNPKLWTHENPNLYRVEVLLSSNAYEIDDEMLTTGIRTVSQEGGIFRINGKPELLGGAQTMGFRMPIENNAKWNRCPPSSILADELLACKKLGNMLRIHVHSGGTYAHSVNDPRVAEMADQLGLMLIWPTTAWIREGEWGGIDFEGYPMYMEQVFNHPSIVIWEGANHPNKFEGKPLSYSNRFISKIYNTIAGTDTSRLISPSSYNRHFAYINDEGTIGQNGDSIVACREWTAPLIIRGNQDALTGYGASWHNISKWPDPYRKSFLESKHRAYFNFEHEESIGMQNFSLAKGKPWYQMPSYENIYDIGSIGRELSFNEWRTSQAWQAFSAWESMKWQRMFDVDGFSWCCLHGGPNSGTYRKPLIDALGHAKLAFYINEMVLNDIIACSSNTDVVYHKKDELTPVIISIGDQRTVKLKVIVEDINGNVIESREYENITLETGRKTKKLPSFRPDFSEEGYYIIKYLVLTQS